MRLFRKGKPRLAGRGWGADDPRPNHEGQTNMALELLADNPPTLVSPLVIGEGRQLIGPETASRILSEFNYERQRSVKPYRLHRHVETIKRGQWDGDCTIRFARLNGRLILVDGQHRLTAITKTEARLPFIVVVTEMNSEAEVHTAYSRIDVDGNRSIADILNAADPAAGKEVSAELLRNGYYAMDALANGFPHRKLRVGENELVTKEDRAICLSYWINELEAFSKIVQAGQSNLRRRFRVPGIMAVALATLRHQPIRAKSFWTNVAQNKLLQPGDPEQALVNFLLTATLDDTMWTSHRGAAQAWNSAFYGRRLQGVKKNASSGPIRIAGTPFQGRD